MFLNPYESNGSDLLSPPWLAPADTAGVREARLDGSDIGVVCLSLPAPQHCPRACLGIAESLRLRCLLEREYRHPRGDDPAARRTSGRGPRDFAVRARHHHLPHPRYFSHTTRVEFVDRRLAEPAQGCNLSADRR